MNNEDQRLFFRQVIEQHKGILYKIARAYCPDTEDRQDLLQEIMLQIWKSISKYDRRFALSTWIYRISLNVAISSYRKKKTTKDIFTSLDNSAENIAEETDREKEEMLNLLDRFISELNQFDKALLILYLEDKSHAEISDILGISVSNVGTRVGRIKEKLKQRFKEII